MSSDGTTNKYSDTLTFTPVVSTNNSSGTATDALSFVGTVVPGKHLTLATSTSFGNIAYTGVPFTTNLTDLSGSWYGTKIQNKQSFLEFFDLDPFGLSEHLSHRRRDWTRLYV